MRYTKQEIREMKNTSMLVDYDYFRKGWRYQVVCGFDVFNCLTSTKKYSKTGKAKTKKQMTECAIEYARECGVSQIEVRNKNYGRVNGSWESKKFAV